MNVMHEGNIIYWNQTSGYGFIECSTLPNSVFFHASSCKYENIQLFDKVSFQISIANSKKHKGKKIAIEINLIEKGEHQKNDLRIGVIYNWNGKFGYIDYPTDGKSIFLYHTRILGTKSIENGDLVVFNPIVSTKDITNLFAFFAYPVSVEKDLHFLKSQYEKYQIPALKDYIFNIYNYSPLTPEDRFEIEVISYSSINSSDDYLKLVALIKRFNKDYSFIADINILSKYIEETYLIQLWESNIISSYDIDTVKPYFVKASATTKRVIIKKLIQTDKEKIADYYFTHLISIYKLNSINNDLKTFLDIIYRNKETRLLTSYIKVKEYLLKTLTPEELIDLWLHNYLDALSDSFVVKNFNIGDKNSIKLLLQKEDQNEKAKYSELFYKIYEQYFIDVSNGNLMFDHEYPNLVKYLKIFEEEFNEKYSEIIDILQKTIKSNQQFTLWVLGVNIKLDAHAYIVQNIKDTNHYFRLKFILRYSRENKSDLRSILDTLQIDLEGLKDFAINYNWNNLVYPTKIIDKEDVHSFLEDVAIYNYEFYKNIDILELADHIYNSIEKYNEVHVRLWLYDYLTDNKYYSFIGFRQCFKNLSNDERKFFRKKANEVDFGEIIENELSEVKPCKEFEQKSKTTKIYSAFVENIYFGEGFLRLRFEDSNYSDEFILEYSSTGLNRIPSTHSLNRELLQIVVDNNKIIEIIGVENLFSKIHTEEIKKALGRVIDANERNQFNYRYVEDWQLRKQIIGYLNANQLQNIETTIVNEPKNYYRRLNESSGIDNFEKTELFTITTENKAEFAIVWENIDLSEDRATYVFKCLKENHSAQIRKIADAIASLAQFRSTLSNTNNENELTIFKNNFGFITSIKKQRGKNESYSNWLVKLESALTKEIPKLPSTEELEKLNDWVPNIPHSARLNKSQSINFKYSAIIREKDLVKTDSLTTHEQNGNYDQIKETIKIDSEYKISLLNTLKKFNQYFTENLNL